MEDLEYNRSLYILMSKILFGESKNKSVLEFRNSLGLVFNDTDLAIIKNHLEQDNVQRVEVSTKIESVADIQPLDDIAVSYVKSALDVCGGNSAKCARLLNVSRSTLYRMLKEG